MEIIEIAGGEQLQPPTHLRVGKYSNTSLQLLWKHQRVQLIKNFEISHNGTNKTFIVGNSIRYLKKVLSKEK